MRHLAAVILLMLGSSIAVAEGPVHKCVGKKGVVFSDKRCDASQKEESIEASVTEYSGRESSRRNREYLMKNPPLAPNRSPLVVVGKQSSQSQLNTPPPPSVQRVNRLHY